jgi:hypothetical protein
LRKGAGRMLAQCAIADRYCSGAEPVNLEPAEPTMRLLSSLSSRAPETADSAVPLPSNNVVSMSAAEVVPLA